MGTIAAWLANKMVVLVVGALAILGAVCTPLAVYDYFQINGANILWWHVNGLKDLAAAEQTTAKSLKTCQTNEALLTGELGKQNVAVQDLHRQLEREKAQGAIAEANGEKWHKDALAYAARVSALKPAGDVCKAALALVHAEAHQ